MINGKQLVLIGLSGALVVAGAKAGSVFEIADVSREAYSRIMPQLSDSQKQQAFLGRSLFRQSWVVAPAEDKEVSGLGPLYNQLACVSCHPKNGRGRPPEYPGEAMRSMLVRLSLPGIGPHGGPVPHPVYGDQLNEQGIPGVPGEGRATVEYSEQSIKLAGGETVQLRKPTYRFADLNYGPLPPNILYSPRIGPPVFGLGLLEAVDENAILQLAEQGKKQGVNGRANLVWNAEKQRSVIGRFGLKANVATLKQQIVGAFIGDMGITTPLHKDENCGETQTACREVPSADHPELSAQRLDAVLLYLRSLQVPARRNPEDIEVKKGEALFAELGCAACHFPVLTTSDFPAMPQLSMQTIHPYTDLLLHDMGEGLADKRPDFQAGGRDWRTPPLWGIGLVERINEHRYFLHDGRARNLTEAVLWHGGEAQSSRDRFAESSAEARRVLLRFLESL